MTVGDMVTQAAQDVCPGGANNDYVYNEQYQMYFSKSTGYYWDPVSKNSIPVPERLPPGGLRHRNS